jgi:hypothetical protein
VGAKGGRQAAAAGSTDANTELTRNEGVQCARLRVAVRAQQRLLLVTCAGSVLLQGAPHRHWWPIEVQLQADASDVRHWPGTRNATAKNNEQHTTTARSHAGLKRHNDSFSGSSHQHQHEDSFILAKHSPSRTDTPMLASHSSPVPSSVRRQFSFAASSAPKSTHAYTSVRVFPPLSSRHLPPTALRSCAHGVVTAA